MKTVIVTGAARRIGRAIAENLHQENYNVVIHYNHSENEANTLAKKLNNIRENSAMTFQCDLLELDRLPLIVEEAVSKWGRLDAVVNNASAFYPTDIDNSHLSHWRELMGTNVVAPYFLIKAAKKHLQESKGSIVNIIDTHADKPLKNYPIYSATKGAFKTLTFALAKELAPDIRVNGVSPGAIAWPEGDNSLSEEQKQKIVSKILLERSGEPLDIAKAVKFFLCDAPYVTGQNVYVDGGRSL